MSSNLINSINGPVVTIKGPTDLTMQEMVYVGSKKLIGEVISISAERTTIQVYETTTGLRVGEEIIGTGAPLSATLGPGIISNIFDGIERPLEDIEKTDGAFIGTGSMAAAIIRGMVAGGVAPGDILAFNRTREKADALANELGITVCDTLEAAAQAGAIVLATTPQSFADILPRVGRAMRTDALVMSIAAGYGIAAIREGIGRDAGIIRIMPNVNANVCASTTGYATSASITAAQLDAFHFGFGKIGELIELDEGEFETFSAIAGCGVAYVYMFIDAMARAGLRNGLSKQKALSIAASAVMGSAKLVSESGMHPYALIDSVTTPGGTTIEGVLTLQRCGFESAVHAAIQASIDKELGMK